MSEYIPTGKEEPDTPIMKNGFDDCTCGEPKIFKQTDPLNIIQHHEPIPKKAPVLIEEPNILLLYAIVLAVFGVAYYTPKAVRKVRREWRRWIRSTRIL